MTQLRSPLPRSATVLGLGLYACAWLPITPGGRSFFQVAVEAFGHGLMPGLVMVLGLGSPFLFGLGVALGNTRRDDASATSFVRMPVTMIHSQLLLMAWVIWREGEAVAGLPLLLFAAVSSLYLIQHSAATRAAGRPASFRWYVRWGAMVVAAIAAWLVLQRLAGLHLGVAVEVAGLCALGLALRSSAGAEPAAEPDIGAPEPPEDEDEGDVEPG